MKHTPPPKTHATPPIHRKPTVSFDWTDWLPYLADSNIPQDQQQEWIETLWSIILGFVDLGFEVKPTSETSGQAIDLKAALHAAVLHSEHAALSTLPTTEEDAT